MKQNNNTKTLYWIISVLVLIILGYLANSWYKNQIVEAQEQGFEAGVAQSVVTIIQQSQNCQIVPLFIDNQTFNFIDVGCIQTN